MILTVFILAILAVAYWGYWKAQRLALASVRPQEKKRSIDTNAHGLKALPRFYGLRILFLVLIPVIVLLLAWSLTENRLINLAIDQALPAEIDRNDTGAYLQVTSHVLRVAEGFEQLRDPSFQAAVDWIHRIRWFGDFGVLALLGMMALGFLAFGLSTSRAGLSARDSTETWNIVIMFLASCVAVFITIGIVLSLLVQAITFFESYPIWDFLKLAL